MLPQPLHCCGPIARGALVITGWLSAHLGPSPAVNHLVTWSLLPIVFITIGYATRLNSM